MSYDFRISKTIRVFFSLFNLFFLFFLKLPKESEEIRCGQLREEVLRGIVARHLALLQVYDQHGLSVKGFRWRTA